MTKIKIAFIIFNREKKITANHFAEKNKGNSRDFPEKEQTIL